MKKLCLSLACFFFYGILIAQDNTTLIIKAGTNVLETVSIDHLYHFPAFTEGKVHFRNGRISKANMNYYLLLDEMHFIAPNGDTTALTDEANISFIAIGRDTFFHAGGYVKLVVNQSKLKLAQAIGYKVTERRKNGPYGMNPPASSTTTLSSFDDGLRNVKLSMNEDVVLKKQNQFYIGGQLNHFTLASKKGLLNLYPHHEESLKQFFKKEKTDFSKQADLEKLLQFLSGLTTDLNF